MNKIEKIYELLYRHYGPQGWWPFINYEEPYHKGDYSFPKDQNEVFEVCLGSILTQNTSFTSVERSLQNLQALDALTPEKILLLSEEEFRGAIKPSGYFNQKAGYIRGFTEFFLELHGAIPSRKELLKIKGIGEETADSILLYGYNEPQFKVDAYTKRLLFELGLISEKAKYGEIKELMQSSLVNFYPDTEELVKVYQEYHALIVCHGKNFYSKKTYGVGCFLKSELKLFS